MAKLAALPEDVEKEKNKIDKQYRRIERENRIIERENRRIIKENERILWEKSNLSKEILRLGREKNKIYNENERILLEKNNLSNEYLRLERENRRVDRENKRIERENSRLARENNNIEKEKKRLYRGFDSLETEKKRFAQEQDETRSGWHRLGTDKFVLFIRGNRQDIKSRLHSLEREPWTSQWADCFLPDDIVYDVGANIGCMTLYFACCVSQGKVYAFEPSRYAFDDLVANINHNGLTNAEPMRLGVAEESGERTLNYSSIVSSAALHKWDGAAGVHSEVVPVVSLDAFADAHAAPDHIYIDTDGFERGVLGGAARCLATCQSVLCEFESPESYGACEPLLQAAGLKKVVTFEKVKDGAVSPWFQVLFSRSSERFGALRQLETVKGQYFVTRAG